jgi:hypothetical protein
MKKISLLIMALVLALGLALPMAAPVAANGIDWALWAGGGNWGESEELVGGVLVWNDADNLYVRYHTFLGWEMYETHLAVADDLEGIPQKNGNPRPGKFPYKDDHDPAVTEYTYQIPLAWDPGTELYIAAHAAVQLVDDGAIIQDETAWGDCNDFPGKNWAKYIIYVVTD